MNSSDIDFEWLSGLAARLRRQGHTDGCVAGADAIDMLCEHIQMLESAVVSIDVDSHLDGDGLRVFGRVVDWQPEDREAGGSGKPIGIRLLCEYESDNFGMRKPKQTSR